MSKKKIVFRYTILFLCCCVIFYFSSNNGENSTGKSDKVFEIYKQIFLSDYDSLSPAEQFEIRITATHYIRKAAHFFIYSCLGFFAFSALFQIRRRLPRLLFATAFCCIYACTDEIHQTFVSGRTGLATDVLIDTCGGFTGACFALLIIYILYRIRLKKGLETIE